MIFTIHFLFKRFLCLQPCQILVECRIRDIHTAGAQDFRRCLCGKRSDCKRHRNAVVEAAVDLGAWNGFPPSMIMPSSVPSRETPIAVSSFTMISRRFDSLTFSSSAFRITVVPFAVAARTAMIGISSIRVGISSPR